ncbi:unnamed protein product [Gongylonema pulchrum]|uniref:Uncharacterized protein n=1 Tax=Gongylonema pulchrum TaxID=637853 RepID=A0A3P7PLQ8_9BILA|nr:unnamed protein product [Gongylonema pulchrum]
MPDIIDAETWSPMLWLSELSLHYRPTCKWICEEVASLLKAIWALLTWHIVLQELYLSDM